MPDLRLRLIAVLSCAMLAPMSALADDPGRPPSKLVPARGLTFYLEYDGLDAHAEAWKATAASEILNETPAGAIMTDVARRTLDRLFKLVPGHSLTGADFLALQDHVVHRGFALASHEVDGRTSTVFLLRDFDRKETLDRFERLLRFSLKPGADAFPPAPTKVRGRDVRAFRKPEAAGPFIGFEGVDIPQAGPTWWFEGSTLVLVNASVGDLWAEIQRGEMQKSLDAEHRASVNSILDAIEGKTPNASTHPGLVAGLAQGRDLAGFEPNGLFFAESIKDAGVLDELRARIGAPRLADGGASSEFDLAEVLGLGQARRVVGRWGFRGKALLSDTRFEAAGPWKGVAGMLDPAGFRKDRLPPIPRSSGTFGVGSFVRGLDAESLAILRALSNDEARPYHETAEQILADAENRRCFEEMVGQLGRTWSLYAAPSGDDKEVVPTFLVDVKDLAAFEKKLDAMASRLNAFAREQELGKEAEGRPSIVLERLGGPDRGYRLTSPTNQVPWLTDRIRPTILIGKSSVVLAANLNVARAALASESEPENRWERTVAASKLFEVLPTNLALLTVGNPRDSAWPEGIANLPRTIGPFLRDFLGVDLEESRPSGLLSLFGVRPAVASTAVTMKAEEIGSRIFPSILAATVDDRSVRIIRLEALPFGCIRPRSRVEGPGISKNMTIDLKFAPGN